MRKTTAATAILIILLVTAGAALAQFTQVAKVRLTAQRAGQSTGIVSDLHSSDPTAPGGKPKAATQVVMTFPVGTRFNLGTSLVVRCRYSDKQLADQFGPKCPSRSLIGSGSAVANAAPITASLAATARAYVRSAREMVIVVTPKQAAYRSQIQVIHATVTGSKLTIPIPRIVLGGLVQVVLVSLKLNVPALGTGRTALVSAGRCSKHAFAVTTQFTYADHSRQTVTSSSRCS